MIRPDPADSQDAFLRAELDSVVRGDCLDLSKLLPERCIQAIVTSPPYYRLRDYSAKHQVGRENSPEHYIERLVSIFAELRRALRDDGTLWLNLGDSYRSGQLLGIPWRVALALQSAGWILRSDIIWHKPNAMPSSITSRPTTDHEYIFLFSKTSTYYYDADSIREPHVTFSENSKMRGGRRHFGIANGTPEAGKNAGNQNLHHGRWDLAFHPLGRNKRTVWSVPLGKFRDAHFAVFPPDLIEPAIKAGSQIGDIVLDPFIGSGTVGVVSKRLKRHYLGFEVNEKYVEMAIKRISETEEPLF